MKERKLDGLKGRCATCAHWDGDTELALKMYEDNPSSMDLSSGCPPAGECTISSEWMGVSIFVNATTTVEVDANFGCFYYKE